MTTNSWTMLAAAFLFAALGGSAQADPLPEVPLLPGCFVFELQPSCEFTCFANSGIAVTANGLPGNGVSASGCGKDVSCFIESGELNCIDFVGETTSSGTGTCLAMNYDEADESQSGALTMTGYCTGE